MTPEQKRALQAAAIARAQRLAQQPGGVSTNSEAVADFRGKLGSLADGLGRGGTFGLTDELAGVRGMINGQGYAPARDARREELAQSQEANPLQFGLGSIAGATVPAAIASPVGVGNSVLQTAGRGMGIGAAEGALHGAGNADGRGVVPQGIRGGLVGAGLGVAAPAVVGAAGAVKNAAQDPVTGIVDTLFNRANTGKANRAIAQMMRGQDPDDVGRALMRAAQEGQPEYRLMDAAGVRGQRQASGIARAGGDSGAEIAEYLAKRQAGQGERVAGIVDDGFGMGGTTAQKTTQSLKESRGQAADAAYDAARGNAAPVDVRGALGVIDARIGGMKGSGVAGDSIDGKLAGYRQRLAADPAPNGEISRELSDFDRVLGVKQAIQDDIGAAVRAGRNNEARELGKLLTELDSALEASSDMYRTANDGFRDASRVIDAVEEGAAMSRPSARADDTISRFGNMTPPQQQSARVGYGDSLLSKIEANTSPTANKAKILQSPKRDAEAGAMTLDPALYGRRVGRENDMWETQNRALGGSRTADNLEDISNTSEIASGVGGVARSLANLQFGDAAARAAGVLGPVARGQNDATRQLIARALMSNDPQKALAPALRQDMGKQKVRRLIEALMRQPLREGLNQ